MVSHDSVTSNQGVYFFIMHFVTIALMHFIHDVCLHVSDVIALHSIHAQLADERCIQSICEVLFA